MSASKAGGRKVLGRGLDALLPNGEHVGLLEVAIDRIEPNPQQPRQHFSEEALKGLAASVREHGILQPLVVSAIGDDRYRLLVGERRWRAASVAGLQRVPVVVKDVTDRQVLEMALVENVQRADLNPLEEAAAYHRLQQDFGLKQEEIAQHVGKSRTAIANTLRLLTLPDALKRAVIEERISEGHARALLSLPHADVQLAVLARVQRDELSVRQTEELVRRLLAPPVSETRKVRASPDLEAIEGELRRALGTKVVVRTGRKGGRIVIEYYSEEEFQGLYDRLVGSDGRL